jgi:hypothetical protein
MKMGAYPRVAPPTVPHYTGRLSALPYLLKKTRLRNNLTYFLVSNVKKVFNFI